MNFDINVTAGLLAGVAAMIPGSVVYSPMTATGKLWMKEVGHKKGDKGKYTPAQAMGLMLVTALVSGLIASVFVSTGGAASVMDAVDVCLLLSWLPISVLLALSFFEKRSLTLAGIGILNQVTTFIVMGVVLGLFL